MLISSHKASKIKVYTFIISSKKCANTVHITNRSFFCTIFTSDKSLLTYNLTQQQKER